MDWGKLARNLLNYYIPSRFVITSCKPGDLRFVICAIKAIELSYKVLLVSFIIFLKKYHTI